MSSVVGDFPDSDEDDWKFMDTPSGSPPRRVTPPPTTFSRIYGLYYITNEQLSSIPNFEEKLGAVYKYACHHEPLLQSIHRCLSKQTEPFRSFTFNVESILSSDDLCQSWPDFQKNLHDSHVDVARLWSLVLHQVLLDKTKVSEERPSTSFQPFEDVRLAEGYRLQAGFISSRRNTRLRDIGVSSVGQYVFSVGRVIGIENVTPVPVVIYFMCRDCDEKFPVEQYSSRYQHPSRCQATDDCEGSTFTLLQSDQENVYTESRWVTVQDVYTGSQDKQGNSDLIPVTYQCMLTGGITDTVKEFQVVNFGGVVLPKHAKSKPSTFHDLFVHIYGMQGKENLYAISNSEEFTLSDRDEEAIHEISRDELIFSRLVQSFRPDITVNLLVKAGLLLQLLGGSFIHSEEDTGTRQNIHSLLIGDQGTGKSQLLLGLCEICPRSEFVCGAGVTPAGLTIALSRGGNNFEIRTGALVRASGGILLLDEFDKVRSDNYACLLEVLEQQHITVAKASISRRIEAKTSVAAAGNPKFTTYKADQTFKNNTKISEALLNRFDMVYVLQDKPSAIVDRAQVCAFVRMYPGLENQLQGTSQYPISASCLTQENLSYRLGYRTESSSPLPTSLLSKYILYARRVVSPRLIPESKRYLIDTFMQHNASAPPSRIISTRQLESLVRLAQARAKVDLSDVVTLNHAMEAGHIFTYAFETTLTGPEAPEQRVVQTSSTAAANRRLIGKRGIHSVEATSLEHLLREYVQRQTVESRIMSKNQIMHVAKSANFRSNTEKLISILVGRCVLMRRGDDEYFINRIN